MIDLTVASDYWDRQHFSNEFLRGEWSFHPAAKARLHRILGAPSREQWFCDNYLKGKTGLRALSIGAGRCTTELRILSMSGIARYDLYDISPVALEAGRATAEEIGVADRANFICADINEIDLGEGAYDVITFIASLHHIQDVGEILARCRRALAPGGVIWAAEYIGPNYFAYPPEHTEFAQRFWSSVKDPFKKTWVDRIVFPTVEEVIASDPTESVNSANIRSEFETIFDEVRIIETYGTFAFILFWGLNHDYLYDTEEGRKFVELVLDIDTALIDSGALPHYFAYLIGSKEPEPKSLVEKLKQRLSPR